CIWFGGGWGDPTPALPCTQGRGNVARAQSSSRGTLTLPFTPLWLTSTLPSFASPLMPLAFKSPEPTEPACRLPTSLASTSPEPTLVLKAPLMLLTCRSPEPTMVRSCCTPATVASPEPTRTVTGSSGGNCTFASRFV